MSELYPGGIPGPPVVNMGYNGGVMPPHQYTQAHHPQQQQQQQQHMHQMPHVQQYPTGYYQNLSNMPMGSSPQQGMYHGAEVQTQGGGKKRKVSDVIQGSHQQHQSPVVNIKQEPGLYLRNLF